MRRRRRKRQRSSWSGSSVVDDVLKHPALGVAAGLLDRAVRNRAASPGMPADDDLRPVLVEVEEGVWVEPAT